MTLKCTYDQIFDIIFFYIFVHNRSSLDTLPNFNLLRSTECMFHFLYFCESTATINFSCSNSWLKTGVIDVIFSKIQIITISVEN